MQGVFNGNPYIVKVGDTFNCLTIEKLYSNRRCDCKCVCGNHVNNLKIRQLQSGNNKSCGCYNRKLTSERNYVHGESKTRLYKIWQGIKKRCLNKNSRRYCDYGGRGITICEEWLEWSNFKNWAIANGYDDNLSIERIDYNKGYNPENCTWISLPEQSKNRRSCHWITFNNKTMDLTDWAKEVGLSRNCLNSRLRIGWSIEKALTTPLLNNTATKER